MNWKNTISRAAAGIYLLTLSATAQVVIFPAPAGLADSPRFNVQVNVAGNWSNSFVNFNAVRTFGSGSTDQPGKSFSWTTFETAGPTMVRVQRQVGSFTNCVIRPTRYGITPTNIGGNTVEFSIQPGQKVSVEFNTDIKTNYYDGTYGIPSVTNILMVFADPIRTGGGTNGVAASDIFFVTPGTNMTNITVTGATPPSAGRCTLGNANGKKVVVFQPGVYDIGYWQVPTNIDQIHLAGGAVVYGAIDVIPHNVTPYDNSAINSVWRDNAGSQKLRSSFKVTGPGVLSGEKLPWHLKKDFTYTSSDDWWAHVKLLQLAVTNITVEDVTLCSSPHWVLTFINDDDARTKGTFDNFKMVGAWTYNNDGLPNPSGASSIIKNAFIHADDDSLKIYNNDSSITNCVVWQANNGAVIQFGWFAKTATNVTVRDIDVIHFENWYGAGQVNRAVFNYANAGGSGTIRDIRFHNFFVEGKVLRLFGFNTVGSAQVIRDLSFNNLTCGGMGVGNLGTAPGANYFNGIITNWAFTNFVFGGTNITSLIQASNVAQFQYTNGAGTGFKFSSGIPNTPPTIAPIGAQIMGANGSQLVNVTIGDAETAPSSLILTGASTNQSLLPDGNIVLGGSGSNRMATLYPVADQTGQSLLTLTVSDGTGSTNASFLLTVTNAPNIANSPPTLNPLPPLSISAGGSFSVPFTVGDAEQSVLALVVSGGSSNQTLLPDASLQFAGSGSNRTLNATATIGVVGTSLVTVTVSDGYTNTSGTFLLTATNAPPVITAQPVSQSANVGQNISFSVTATGSAPLAYQWQFNDATNIAGATNAILTLTSLDLTDAGDYRVVVTNTAGSVTSSVAVLTVNTNAGGRLYWIGGTASGIMSNTNNYRLNPDATGGAPPTIGAGDVIEYTATGTVNQSISQSTVVAYGAFHNNTNTAGTGYVFFNGSAGTGTWTINRAVVESITNAAFINDQNRGFNFKADVVLKGGGEFVFSHASASSGEYQGNSFGENNGAATLVFQGQTAGGGNALFIWGKSDGSTAWNFTGGVTVREKASVDFVNGFNIAPSGGVLIVDPDSTGARFKMGRITTNTVAQLLVRGVSVPVGTYTKAQLNTLLGLSGDTVFEGSGGMITVTGAPGTNTPPVISPIANQSMLVNSDSAVNFTVTDAETAAGSLNVSASSSNTNLMPPGALVLSGAGSNRSLTLRPAPWQIGSSVVTVTVSDSLSNLSSAFVVTVTNVPVPFISGNLLSNANFESGVGPWSAYNPAKCAVQQATNTSYTGAAAVRVFNRTDRFTGVQQQILAQLLANGPGYYAYAARGRTESGTLNTYTTLRLVDQSGTRYFAAPGQSMGSANWMRSAVTNFVNWTNLTDAYLYAETSTTNADPFLVDEVSLKFHGPTPGGFVPSGAVIVDAAAVGAALVFTASNGVPNGSFDVLTSAELLAPITVWTVGSSGLVFNASGKRVVTNSLSAGASFFRLRE